MNKLTINFEGITVGQTIHNTNGDDYMVIAINPQQDRTLLVKLNTKDLYYVGAWALRKANNDEGWYWGQGHYYGSQFEAAVQYVLGKESEKKKVWIIHTDWTIDSGEHASDSYPYATYEIAKREFDKLVNEDKTVNYDGYDEEDTSYEWEEEKDYWNIWESGYYNNNHSEIRLIEHIIEEE